MDILPSTDQAAKNYARIKHLICTECFIALNYCHDCWFELRRQYSQGFNQPKQRTASTITDLSNIKLFGSSFIVGIIGLGRIGKCILNHFLQSKIVNSNSLLISTRRPLTEASQYPGISIIYDNEKVFRECNIVFICVLPHQFKQIVFDVPRTLLVFSCSVATTSARLKLLFSTPSVHRTLVPLDSTTINSAPARDWLLDLRIAMSSALCSMFRSPTSINAVEQICYSLISNFNDFAQTESNEDEQLDI